jgi:CelD/BcsL family acetyltransferase involved in cellulose biosynthesis
VETINAVSGFADLRQEWNQLLQSSNSENLFLTWEWLWTWWEHLAGDRRLSILVVRSRGSLIALAPCSLRSPSLLNGRPIPTLEFLGTGSVGSDYLDVIVRCGRTEEATRAIASHLAEQRLMLRWTQLKRNQCLAAHVASALGDKGWRIAETETNICPYIPLNGSSWESYLLSLGAEHRYNFHRKWKRLNREYTLRLDQVRTPLECRESIDLVIALHNLRWSNRGGSDAFHTPELVRFHQEFSNIALDRGWLRLYVLRLDEKPVACLYGFLYRRVFYFYQSGFDAAYDKHSVGLITLGLAIKSAIEERAEEFDLLHGSEAYKSHWCCDSRELSRLEAYPPRVLGWACQSSVDLGRAARKVARRVLPKGLFA